jgi:asparagine N-glycosylation enzyme membrane subunit Stt3
MAVGSAVIVFGSIAGIAGRYVLGASVALGIVSYFVAPFWLTWRFLAGHTQFDAGVLTVMLSLLVLLLGVILRRPLGADSKIVAVGIALAAVATYGVAGERGLLWWLRD